MTVPRDPKKAKALTELLKKDMTTGDKIEKILKQEETEDITAPYRCLPIGDNKWVEIKAKRISALPILKKCDECGGHGKEICDNPDHSFINAVGGEMGRLGCPCCGHDEFHRTKHNCEPCKGKGEVPGTLKDLIEGVG